MRAGCFHPGRQRQRLLEGAVQTLADHRQREQHALPGLAGHRVAHPVHEPRVRREVGVGPLVHGLARLPGGRGQRPRRGSGVAITRFDATSGHDVGALLRAGEPEAARLTKAAGKRIGEVVATMVCLLNPEVVLVGGDLASAPLRAGMRETLYRLANPARPVTWLST